MSVQGLYDRAAELGIDFEPGFDDDLLVERVALGLCDAGIVGGYPCAGCAACAPKLDVLAMVARGEEHAARELHGDVVVDDAIRAGLAAEGWDLELCVMHANGWGS
jgi:hypothetical protein